MDPLCANLRPGIKAWGGRRLGILYTLQKYWEGHGMTQLCHAMNNLSFQQVWRFFTFTFFHLQFLDLFQNLLTLLDTLDVEAGQKFGCLDSWPFCTFQVAQGTPPIILGDGSNLKCGAAWRAVCHHIDIPVQPIPKQVGAKQNFMCYPSIGHALREVRVFHQRFAPHFFRAGLYTHLGSLLGQCGRWGHV